MTRIRHIKPRVEPPKGRAVLWMSAQGPYEQCLTSIERPKWATHWCTLPSIDGTPSGPVYSAEPEELPEPGKDVLVRLPPRGWYVARRDAHGFVANLPGGSFTRMMPDAWRPLPDDEPGDAELLEAARALLNAHDGAGPHFVATRLEDLRVLVEKRSGKEKP